MLLMMKTLQFCIGICYFLYEVMDQSPTTTTIESANENKRHFALMKANLLMDIHFDN